MLRHRGKLPRKSHHPWELHQSLPQHPLLPKCLLQHLRELHQQGSLPQHPHLLKRLLQNLRERHQQRSLPEHLLPKRLLLPKLLQQGQPLPQHPLLRYRPCNEHIFKGSLAIDIGP